MSDPNSKSTGTAQTRGRSAAMSDLASAMHLGERCVAVSCYRPVPGMLVRAVEHPSQTGRVAGTEVNRITCLVGDELHDQPFDDQGWSWVPDLADPATLGCIAFALLPAGWRVWPDASGTWFVTKTPRERFANGERIGTHHLVGATDLKTALVYALEKADGWSSEGQRPATRDLVVFTSSFLGGEPMTHATLDGRRTLCGRTGWETSEGWSAIGPDCLRCARALDRERS